MSDPGRVALLDQAGAATAEALAIEEALAAASAGVAAFRWHPSPGIFMDRCVQLADKLRAAGRLVSCKHLGGQAPQPSYWFAWALQVVSCGECAGSLCERVAADVNAYRCDRCRTQPPGAFWLNSYVQPATLADVVDGPVVVPPVTFRIGLCGLCQTFEDSPLMFEGER